MRLASLSSVLFVLAIAPGGVGARPAGAGQAGTGVESDAEMIPPVRAAVEGFVTSDVYENLDADRGLNEVPVTFSRVGAAGHFTRGVTPVMDGVRLPAQVDVLRKAPDGSVRHALVSFVVPRWPAGGKVRIAWLNEPPPQPPAFRAAFAADGLSFRLVLTTETGKVLVSKADEILAVKLSGCFVKIVHDGPVMRELEVRDAPVDSVGRADPELEVRWRVRAFTGAKSVRVEAIVERTRDRVQGVKVPVQYKFKSVELLAGDKTLYREGPFDHLDQTRYRILVWSHGPLENIHRRPDYDYWVQGRFFPRYGWTKAMTVEEVERTYLAPTADRPSLRRSQGILENGMIHRHMPGTGGRWEMNPYPSWIPAYLMSGAPRLYQAILHADGNGAGAFYIHVRQDGCPGYNVLTVRQPPLDQGYRIGLYTLPDGTRNPVQPDHAHAPSLGYLSYLLTGDRFYAEELSFWASFQMGEWPHKGLNWRSMDRAFAWSLRQVTDAAYVLPETDTLQSYFTKGVNDCLDEMTERLVKSGRHVHAPAEGGWKVSGRQNWVNATLCSSWMYAWVVWSLGNAVDKGFDKARPVRDWAAEFIVGLYTSTDEFHAPDGKVYRYDPKDAMSYSTAIQLLETRIETKDGVKDLRVVRKLRDLDNYGEIWYYTKMNEDNAWSPAGGGPREPDAAGCWPLRENGWGHGFAWDAAAGKQSRQYNWHRYGAWVALVTALDAEVPNARQAWQVMLPLAGTRGEYDMEMAPHSGAPEGNGPR